ncbi:TPA: hypothetical protein DIS56_04030, partial [Candidatus Saccharibacteria bacterium]|nr:hypothetical protein [Candidatus Saccharibacteria bacterium]
MAEPAANPFAPSNKPNPFNPPVQQGPFNNRPVQQAGFGSDFIVPGLVGTGLAYSADKLFNKGRGTQAVKSVVGQLRHGLVPTLNVSASTNGAGPSTNGAGRSPSGQLTTVPLKEKLGRGGLGWKLHLNVGAISGEATEAEAAARAKPVAQLLKELQKRGLIEQYKSTLETGIKYGAGKDFTVYIGSRDDAKAVGQIIEKRVGKKLLPQSGAVSTTDGPVNGSAKVWGRFDIGSDEAKRIKGDPRFRFYGKEGVPILKEAPDLATLTPEERSFWLKKSYETIKRDYGEIFTGKRGDVSGVRFLEIPATASSEAGAAVKSAETEVGRLKKLVSGIRGTSSVATKATIQDITKGVNRLNGYIDTIRARLPGGLAGGPSAATELAAAEAEVSRIRGLLSGLKTANATATKATIQDINNAVDKLTGKLSGLRVRFPGGVTGAPTPATTTLSTASTAATSTQLSKGTKAKITGLRNEWNAFQNDVRLNGGNFDETDFKNAEKTKQNLLKRIRAQGIEVKNGAPNFSNYNGVRTRIDNLQQQKAVAQEEIRKANNIINEISGKKGGKQLSFDTDPRIARAQQRLTVAQGQLVKAERGLKGLGAPTELPSGLSSSTAAVGDAAAGGAERAVIKGVLRQGAKKGLSALGGLARIATGGPAGVVAAAVLSIPGASGPRPPRRTSPDGHVYELKKDEWVKVGTYDKTLASEVKLVGEAPDGRLMYKDKKGELIKWDINKGETEKAFVVTKKSDSYNLTSGAGSMVNPHVTFYDQKTGKPINAQIGKLKDTYYVMQEGGAGRSVYRKGSLAEVQKWLYERQEPKISYTVSSKDKVIGTAPITTNTGVKMDAKIIKRSNGDVVVVGTDNKIYNIQYGAAPSSSTGGPSPSFKVKENFSFKSQSDNKAKKASIIQITSGKNKGSYAVIQQGGDGSKPYVTGSKEKVEAWLQRRSPASKTIPKTMGPSNGSEVTFTSTREMNVSVPTPKRWITSKVSNPVTGDRLAQKVTWSDGSVEITGVNGGRYKWVIPPPPVLPTRTTTRTTTMSVTAAYRNGTWVNAQTGQALSSDSQSAAQAAWNKKHPATGQKPGSGTPGTSTPMPPTTQPPVPQRPKPTQQPYIPPTSTPTTSAPTPQPRVQPTPAQKPPIVVDDIDVHTNLGPRQGTPGAFIPKGGRGEIDKVTYNPNTGVTNTYLKNGAIFTQKLGDNAYRSKAPDKVASTEKDAQAPGYLQQFGTPDQQDRQTGKVPLGEGIGVEKALNEVKTAGYQGETDPNKTYSFTDVKGRDNTLTFRNNGVVIQQSQGGNPYVIWDPAKNNGQHWPGFTNLSIKDPNAGQTVTGNQPKYTYPPVDYVTDQRDPAEILDNEAQASSTNTSTVTSATNDQLDPAIQAAMKAQEELPVWHVNPNWTAPDPTKAAIAGLNYDPANVDPNSKGAYVLEERPGENGKTVFRMSDGSYKVYDPRTFETKEGGSWNADQWGSSEGGKIVPPADAPASPPPPGYRADAGPGYIYATHDGKTGWWWKDIIEKDVGREIPQPEPRPAYNPAMQFDVSQFDTEAAEAAKTIVDGETQPRTSPAPTTPSLATPASTWQQGTPTNNNVLAQLDITKHGNVLATREGKNNNLISQMSDGSYRSVNKYTGQVTDAGWWGDGKGGGVSQAGIGNPSQTE